MMKVIRFFGWFFILLYLIYFWFGWCLNFRLMECYLLVVIGYRDCYLIFRVKKKCWF